MPTMNEVIKRMRIELADAKDALQRWEGEAKVKSSLAKLEVKEAMDHFNRTVLHAEDVLERVDKDAGAAWDDLKGGVEKAWHEMKMSWHAAKKHFD